MISLWFIALVSAIASLGYLIAPDSTPNSNSQHLEIAVQKPGFSTQILLQQKPTSANDAGFISMLTNGKESVYKELAICSYSISGGYINVKEFTAYKNEQPLEHRLTLAEVLLIKYILLRNAG